MAWLADGTETLVFISSDASLLRFSAQLVRPQGTKGGGMAGINLAAGTQVLFVGNRSNIAAQQMLAAGFTNVVDLTGGITAWTAAGRAIVAS